VKCIRDFGGGNLEERDYLEDLSIYGIMSRYMLGRCAFD
jgi:hypothetical protein